jgi:inositol phosphorylceramide mannosyltransferase catalytic subunit
VWLGGSELPPEALRWEDSWRHHHPDWELTLWNDSDLAGLVPAEALERCRSESERSNLVRYAVLARFGGVYVDTDVECRRPLDPLLEGVQAFGGWETEHRLGTAVLGATPGTRVFAELAELSFLTASLTVNSVESTGPGLFTLVAADHPAVTRFDKELFYPYRWDEPHRRHEPFPGSYAVHHWSLSWLDGS